MLWNPVFVNFLADSIHSIQSPKVIGLQHLLQKYPACEQLAKVYHLSIVALSVIWTKT